MEEVQQTIKNPYGFIYITTNMINGMKYLGQKSFDDNNKWRNYLGSGKALKNAIRKYGKQNFDRNIICFCYSPEELNEAEYALSVFLNVVEDRNWYNLCYGGEVPIGYVATDESRRKMSEAQKARWTDELRQELGEKMSGEGNPFYGKHHSDDVRLKLSEQHTGMKVSDEVKKKLSDINKERFKDENERAKCGRPHTDKWKQEQSERMSGENHPMYGKHHSDETKAKIRNARKNLSEDARKRISEAQRKRLSVKENNPFYGKHHSEEAKEKISKANLGRKLSDEIKKKLSEAHAGENSWNCRRVIQYSMSGEKIKTWPYIKAAEEELGISHISQCVNGDRNSAGGFIWRDESSPLTAEEIDALQAANKYRHEGISWYKAHNKWIVYIIINGKRKHIGYFENWDDALAARLKAEEDAKAMQQNNYEGDINAENIKSKD